jgi:alkylation response protein AidB-like acyl-CoA dehydrogenase
MDFDFSDDQKLLKDEARKFFREHCPSSAVRQVLEGKHRHDPALWQRMAAMGWLGAAIPEQYGGQGAGYLMLCVIAEELGRALAPVPLSSSIYLAAELLLAGGTGSQKETYLPRLATGKIVGTLALTEGVGTPTPESIHTTAAGGKITGSKVPVPDGDSADFAIVVARSGSGASSATISLFLVDLHAKGVTRAPVDVVDPTRGHARIDFDGAAAEPLGPAGGGWPLLTRTMDRAAVLMAFEQLGGADRSLEMARDYALERVAFGRPIGGFQAVKHMLADMYVSATLARSNCYYGAWALETGAPELPIAAATARVSATQAFQHCAKNSIQVHGGMGFTWEADCHLYYRRSNLLALALGSLSSWEATLINRMRAGTAA